MIKENKRHIVMKSKRKIHIIEVKHDPLYIEGETVSNFIKKKETGKVKRRKKHTKEYEKRYKTIKDR